MVKFLKENINGILGTVVFHLLIIVIFMASRLSSFNDQYEYSLLIEFETDVSEEDFRALAEHLLQSEYALQQHESQVLRRNIAVHVPEDRPVPDQFRDMSSQELSELDERVNEILNQAANGNIPMPEKPEIEFEQPEYLADQEENNDEPYRGPTTITYDLPGRNHIRIPVPVYRCPDGGTVTVIIVVNQQGRVIKADIDGTPADFNEICIFETAVEAAMNSRFNIDSGAPPVQSGTITFYFQKQ